jgi:hypothetical protein
MVVSRAGVLRPDLPVYIGLQPLKNRCLNFISSLKRRSGSMIKRPLDVWDGVTEIVGLRPIEAHPIIDSWWLLYQCSHRDMSTILGT